MEDVETSIPDRFKKIVGRYPDRTAISTLEKALTYRELDLATNRVARAIGAFQKADHEPIGILLGPGIDRIVAFLGVLKSGNFFVPMNPSSPRSQLADILKDTRANLLVSKAIYNALSSQLAKGDLRILDVDQYGYGFSTDRTELSQSPGNLAYTIYTSGSTGIPKGVFQNHRNMLHDIMVRTQALHVSTQDRIAGTGAIMTAFLALLNGATFCPWDIKSKGAALLADFLERQHITIFETIPTVFRDLLFSLTGRRHCSTLRLIWLSGEALLLRDIEAYRKQFSDTCLVLNEFSTTEVASASMFFIDRQMKFSTSVIPVGYAVDDTDVLVLHQNGKVAAEGEVGEIVVKSPYIAQGYWQRPELSAGTFVCDSSGTSLRSFHSGDFGFKSADGCLTHLGRNDRQAKIRGHRVEVAELESELMSVAGIKEAAVAIRDDAFGNSELVAYVVPIVDTHVTASDLRLALAEKLPPEMIPAKTVVLKALPVTPNGKLNRRALPKPENTRPELAVAYVTPLTPVEKELSRIWTEVLTLDRVGILDDFFDLGGHSLAATRVISQVFNYFKFEIPLRSLFESPTVAQMAEVVEEHRGKLFSDEDLECILAQIESMSEDEAQKTLAEKNNS